LFENFCNVIIVFISIGGYKIGNKETNHFITFHKTTIIRKRQELFSEKVFMAGGSLIFHNNE
jgi:hypothetical protein